MNISKSLATDVATKLLEKKQEEYLAIKEALIKEANEIALASISPDLAKAYEKFRPYFNTTSSVMFISHINHTREDIHIDLGVDIPHEHPWGRLCIEITKDQFLSLREKKEKYSNLKDDYKKRFNIVMETIFGLRTANQLKKHFPEAYELLPKTNTGTTLPMINLEKVRQLINS